MGCSEEEEEEGRGSGGSIVAWCKSEAQAVGSRLPPGKGSKKSQQKQNRAMPTRRVKTLHRTISIESLSSNDRRIDSIWSRLAWMVTARVYPAQEQENRLAERG